MNSVNYDCGNLNDGNRKYPKTQSPNYPGRSADGCRLDAPASWPEELLRLGILLLALLCLAATQAQACGPDFPNNLLDSGDYAVLVAPTVRFAEELERMQLVQTRWRAVLSTNDYPQEAADAEIADLTAALRRGKTPAAEIERICSAHRVQRERLHQYVSDYERWQGSGQTTFDSNGEGHQSPPAGDPPKLPALVFVPGLPDEFADYFAGACEWRNPAIEDKSQARAAWERLLARPAAERKFKSTWAAYMLGKSWEDEDQDKAAGYFRQVRELARHGFTDSIGLATASLGWEARLAMGQHKIQQAIHLYLEQLAAGDYSATGSLHVTAAHGFDDPAALPGLAKDPIAQRVITAYLASTGGARWINRVAEDDSLETADEPTTAWLKAVEAAGVEDVDSAEKLALAAYQGGAFDLAQRWIKRASGTPLAQWLQAKLLLREGKIAPAAALLARISGQFPVESAGTNEPASLLDNLYVAFADEAREAHGVGLRVLGELGVLRLNRNQYSESLDALLRSGYWGDAAYVAERVLTLDELKAYVDVNWPTLSASTNDPAATAPPDSLSEKHLAGEIRYLLARRLTRSLRGGEAREYYPEQWRSKHDELVTALIQGWDEAQPAAARASALFRAACITRTNGMELLGTETGPDWFIHGGDFEYGVTAESRVNENFHLLPASANELQRASAHAADPEVRWHYRYQAAFLAWEAAKLMPNNSDETAFVLWQAGVWLKNRDPQTADGFYKTLVRRCRRTALGEEADRIRWFPELDENRQIVRPERPSAVESATGDEPAVAEPLPETPEQNLTPEQVIELLQETDLVIEP